MCQTEQERERLSFLASFLFCSLCGLPRPCVLGLLQQPWLLAKRLRMWPLSQTSYFLFTWRVKKLQAQVVPSKMRAVS